MPRYKITRRLAVEDAAYLAGLIDGEGTITLSRRHAKDRRQLLVSIANTERPLLDYVLGVVGTGKITRKRIAANHHTPSYCYSVSNRQALSLLAQLQSYLRSHKRDRATLALGRYLELTPRNGKYTFELEQQRADFERELLAMKPNADSERATRKETAHLSHGTDIECEGERQSDRLQSPH